MGQSRKVSWEPLVAIGLQKLREGIIAGSRDAGGEGFVVFGGGRESLTSSESVLSELH